MYLSGIDWANYVYTSEVIGNQVLDWQGSRINGTVEEMTMSSIVAEIPGANE